METHNWKLALRNLKRQKRSTILNIIGLSFGLTAILFISVYVYYEFTYDTFHTNYARIFKPEFEITEARRTVDIAANLSIEQVKNFRSMVPGIEAITFLNYSYWDWDNGTWIEYNGNKYNLPYMAFTDDNFTKVFSFGVYSGNLSETLDNPNSIAITKDIANKIFGPENSIGKTVLLNNQPVLIGAILEPIPTNSSLQISGLVSYLSANKYFGSSITDYSNIPFILTRSETSPSQVSETMSRVLYNTLSAEEKQILDPVFKTTLIPLKNMYYYRSVPYDPIKHGNKKTSLVLLFIGVIILILAVINYNNLLMAVSLKREKDFSIHRIFGAGRQIIRQQFFIKGFLISLLAFVLAVLLIKSAFPWFNELVMYPLQGADFFKIHTILITLLVLFISMLMAGLLPTLFHKKSQLINQVKQIHETGRGKGHTWKGLVTFQLFISISLLTSAIVILKQINYSMSKDLGITIENVITIPTHKLGNKKAVFINSVTNNPQTISHCLSTTYLNNYNIWGGVLKEPGENKKDVDYTNVRVNQAFLKTLEIDLIKGRDFDENYPSDIDKYIINKAFVDYYNINNPLESTIDGHKIIGVVNNFNYNSLHDKIEPMVLWNTPDHVGLSSFRFQASTKEELKRYISFLKEEWQKLSQDAPFEYEFLDDRVKNMYEKDIKLASTVVSFSILAVFIACLGIFGLLSYIMETKVKEIGIRKVNGAKLLQILQLINFNLVKWVVVASIISFPVSWYITNKWLENFAYKTNLSWWIFALAGVMVLGIAVLTVSWQSWRAARRNPVEALRYE